MINLNHNKTNYFDINYSRKKEHSMFKVSSLNSKVSLWATLSIIFILSLCAHGSALAAEPITPTDLTITPTPSSSISPEQETDLKGSSVISPVAAGAIPVDVLTPPVTHSGLSALNKSKSTGGPKPFKVKGHGKKPTPDVLLSYYYTSYFGSSGWWDSDWEYRKSVTLSRASGAITDYQMKCVINRSTGTDGSPNAYDVYVNTKCNSDYSDIRFINSSETPLDYWIEISDTSSATVWVEFDSIGASDTTFYMYYGNTEASAYSNGVSTFDFFDHFADLTQWGTIGSVSVAGSICTVLRTGDVDAYVYSNSKFPINTAIRARLKSKHFGGSYIEDFGYNNWGVDAKSARGYYSYPYTFPQRYVTYNTGWVNVGAITGVVADTYFIQDVIRNSNSSIIFKVNDANTVTATSDLPVIDLNILSSAVIYNNSETDIDWVLVRKYTTNEPAWGTWGAESQYQPDTTQPVIYHPEPGGGHDGQTFSFDGVDDYVQIGNPSVLQLQYFTALAWIKTSYSPYNIVFSHAPVGSSGWGLAITPEAVYFDDAWVATVLSYSVNLVDGNWHQVGIYRGTDNGIGIIVDGQIVATGTYSSTFGFSNFQIGKRGSGDPYSNPFAGQIDEVAIYDNGLNAQNINDLYTTSKHTTAHVFKREVVISNTGSALTDYQVRADVTYNNRMQSDFDDLRFFDITGTALSYWIESYTAGVSATAWVKAPNLAASSNTTIEMYYGDPNAASDSNGDDTFILFDDFSDDLSKWDTIETGAGTWTPEISGGQLKITAVSNTSGNPCLRSTDEISGDVIIECKVNAISNGTRTWWAIGRGTNLVWWNWREGCNLMFDNHSTIKWAVMSSKDTSGTYYVNNPLLSGYPTPSLNTDYYLRFAVGNAVNGVKNSWAGTSTNYTSYITSSTLSYTHTDK
ncbi:MAG TPA: DUF2341 domain-containing protein, partial [Planctomycetota bacterium]|nr:DUF2341 domain-containing protein [Planctomycetota bacterium]